MGWFSDFVSDPVGRLTKDVEDTGEFLDNAQKRIIQYGRDNIDQLLANVDDMAKATMDYGENIWHNTWDGANNIVKHPLNVNTYSDNFNNWIDNENDYGDKMFGDGGWIKAGANMLSSGNPFVGAGNLAYQLDAAASDSPYDPGLTGPVSNLAGMYDIGNSLANSGGTPSVPDASAASNTVDATTMNPNIPNFEYDPSYDATAAGTGSGAYSQTLQQDPLLNYSGTNGSVSPLLGTSTSPSYDFSTLNNAWNSFQNLTDTKAARLGATALGVVSPEAGVVASGLMGAGTGDFSPFMKGLGQLWITNQGQRRQQRFINNMNDQVNQINRIYSPDGEYSKALEQRLARQDAASGRRSQFGARQAELMGQLADKRAATAAPVLNALGSAQMQKAVSEQQALDQARIGSLMQAYQEYKRPELPVASTQTIQSPNAQGFKLSDIGSYFGGSSAPPVATQATTNPLYNLQDENTRRYKLGSY